MLKQSNSMTVVGLAGYAAGEVELVDEQKLVVRTSPNLLVPVEGDWSTIRALIEGALNAGEDGGEQCLYFHAWCQSVFMALADKWFFTEVGFRPGHALVLAGPPESGKSLLQRKIITPLLGGRAADPAAFLADPDGFNADVMGAEHLLLEDPHTAACSTVKREELASSMKRVLCNETHRLRLKGCDPVPVKPFWRLSISMSDERETLRRFPMLTPDLRGKVIMLLTRRGPMPMATDTAEGQTAFRERLAAEMPAYLHWLTQVFVIPPAIAAKGSRFGFSAFQHPQLGEVLWG